MLIAITGGIGMGKTAVLNDFASFGAKTLDADVISHDVYRPGLPAYNAIVNRWGQAVVSPDASLNRKAIASIVFTSTDELAWLNSLVHPLVREEIQRASAGIQPVYCAIPLLYEQGTFENLAVRVITVWCPPAIQYERLLKRGWSDMEIQRRCTAQIHPDEKLRKADFAIMTDGTFEMTRRQCLAIHQAILKSVSN